MPSLQDRFGPIDIYLFDQLLRGRIQPGMTIFDAGCGYGRNLVYFLQEGYDVFGVDQDPAAIASFARPSRFHAEAIESHTFPDAFADVVLSSAVLHFARNPTHFDAMLRGSWRALKPGGLFFCRLATDIGLSAPQLVCLGNGRFLLPDRSERFLADERTLLGYTRELHAELLDPLKTTLVQNMRAMTTWVLRRAVS